ncbi:37S ribosomal protein S9, mitochondrial [Marasmius sp. AFHP31]|nr:37S ribosomal protein S9, mitochondrial [Marasmius sp. AFHP31]
MNLLRWQALQRQTALRRPACVSSTLQRYAHRQAFAPTAQLNYAQQRARGGRNRRRQDENEEDPEEGRFSGQREDTEAVLKTKPESPSFYTGRATYHDSLIELQNAISKTRGTLKTLQLLPLPEFARESLKPMPPVWKTAEEMSQEFDTKMTTSRYRKVTVLLNELNQYLRIATTAGYHDLATMIDSVLGMFESGKKESYLTRGERKPVILDQYGRSYTVGKRKTSAARVWMIPVKTQAPSPRTVIQPAVTEPTARTNPWQLISENTTESRSPVIVTASTILVNNLPISEYFPQPHDRERIVRPLKVAGVLGKYNVFTLVRGGGTTGQSGAVAHGIAKGVFAHEPETGSVLKRAKLLRRDPRMVERKKTGMAKARKRYTWVKR